MATQPIDYASILGNARALVPDYAREMVQQRLLGIQEQQAQTQQQQVQAAIARQQQQTGELAAYRGELQALGSNPSASQVASLIMRYPQFSEDIKRGWDAQDASRRNTDFRQIAEVNSAARAGNWDVAARLLRQRVEADQQAGEEADPLTQSILNGLESGVPAEQQAARDALERMTAAIAGPEHYASVFGTFRRNTGTVDGVVYDQDTGQPLFQSPYSRIIPGPNGSFYTQPRVGTIPVLGGEVATRGEAGGAQPAPAQGSVGNSSGNNNPGGLRVPGSTAFQRFPTVQAGIAAQEDLLRRSYLNRPTTIRDIIERYAPRRRNGGDNSDASVNNYIAYVSRRTGIPATQQVDANFTAPIAQAMREFETGQRGQGRIAGNNGAPVRVQSRQQYERLASGQQYIAPDGTVRTKR